MPARSAPTGVCLALVLLVFRSWGRVCLFSKCAGSPQLCMQPSNFSMKVPPPFDTKNTFWTDASGSDLLLLSKEFQSWEVSWRLGCRTTLDLSVRQLSHDSVTICYADENRRLSKKETVVVWVWRLEEGQVGVGHMCFEHSSQLVQCWKDWLDFVAGGFPACSNSDWWSCG